MTPTVGAGPTARDAAVTVRDRVAGAQDDLLGLLRELVGIDSGADVPAGIAAVEAAVGRRLAAAGALVRQQEVDGVAHLRATIPGSGPTVALVGHADTVFPRGTAADRPMSVVDGVVRGPGSADMKGGLVMAVGVIDALLTTGAPLPTLEVLVYGDEETRVTAPPRLGLDRLDACLVLECGRPGGGFVTARKAGAWATVTATGAAAHSGVDPDRGRNAITTLCAAVVGLADLHAARPLLTVSPGRIVGGTAVNAVPDTAEARIDLRARTSADLEWALQEMTGRADRAGARVGTVDAWPAMEPEPAAWLSAAYQAVCGELAIPAEPVTTGGMSDGSWFAADGVPTIDGLGPIGALDHSPDEHVHLSSFPDRAGALGGLLVQLATAAVPPASRPVPTREAP